MYPVYSRNPLQRFVWFIKQHKIPVIIGTIVALLIIGGGVAFTLLNAKKPVAVPAPAPVKKQETPPPLPKYYSPLTGIEIPDEATTKKQVRAIMIENSPDARPQSGLKDAGVVFEAIAEGGITRFLTLFQESHPSLIGPVRSVRPYYVDWLAAFDASVSHVGGSKNALDEVRNGTYKDLDQFFNGAYYWRATDRYAPHNVYTSSDKLDQLNQSKGYISSNFTGFARKHSEAPAVTPNAGKIDIDISYALFNVHYDYDQASNSYIRSEGGAKHVDREGGQLQPKVVIAIKVPTVIGFEDGYREQMQTIGSGVSYVFQDGTVTKGTWTKTAKKDQIVFKNDAGEVIPLNAGQTWITAIPTEKSVSWQ
jgi:hypothetical protein